METLKKTSLFWDVNVDSIDPDKNEKFVIERILDFGDRDDVHWAGKYYKKEKLERYVRESKNLNIRSLFFWCQYFNISKKECTQKQSLRKQSWFWTR